MDEMIKRAVLFMNDQMGESVTTSPKHPHDSILCPDIEKKQLIAVRYVKTNKKRIAIIDTILLRIYIIKKIPNTISKIQIQYERTSRYSIMAGI